MTNLCRWASCTLNSYITCVFIHSQFLYISILLYILKCTWNLPILRLLINWCSGNFDGYQVLEEKWAHWREKMTRSWKEFRRGEHRCRIRRSECLVVGDSVRLWVNHLGITLWHCPHWGTEAIWWNQKIGVTSHTSTMRIYFCKKTGF